jgi:hypothetical protein
MGLRERYGSEEDWTRDEKRGRERWEESAREGWSETEREWLVLVICSSFVIPVRLI